MYPEAEKASSVVRHLLLLSPHCYWLQQKHLLWDGNVAFSSPYDCLYCIIHLVVELCRLLHLCICVTVILVRFDVIVLEIEY